MFLLKDSKRKTARNTPKTKTQQSAVPYCISPGQWQPWTSVSSLLGLISWYSRQAAMGPARPMCTCLPLPRWLKSISLSASLAVHMCKVLDGAASSHGMPMGTWISTFAERWARKLKSTNEKCKDTLAHEP